MVVQLIMFWYKSLYQKVWQFSCYLKTGRNVKHLSLGNVYLILFSSKISERLYQMDGSSAPTLQQVEMLSIYHWEMFNLILFLYENKCKVIPKEMVVQLPPNYK